MKYKVGDIITILNTGNPKPYNFGALHKITEIVETKTCTCYIFEHAFAGVGEKTFRHSTTKEIEDYWNQKILGIIHPEVIDL